MPGGASSVGYSCKCSDSCHWDRHIFTHLKKHHMMHYIVTHKAQNICFHKSIMNDWVINIDRWIVAGTSFDDCIMSLRWTLILVHLQTKVSGCILEHSERCTVILGCAASVVSSYLFCCMERCSVSGGLTGRWGVQVIHYPKLFQVGGLIGRWGLQVIHTTAWCTSFIQRVGRKPQERVFAVLLPNAWLQHQQQQNMCYLFQDQCFVHLKEGNISLVNSIGMEVNFIPAGSIACFRVMGKGLHKTFK